MIYADVPPAVVEFVDKSQYNHYRIEKHKIYGNKKYKYKNKYIIYQLYERSNKKENLPHFLGKLTAKNKIAFIYDDMIFVERKKTRFATDEEYKSIKNEDERIIYPKVPKSIVKFVDNTPYKGSNIIPHGYYGSKKHRYENKYIIYYVWKQSYKKWENIPFYEMQKWPNESVKYKADNLIFTNGKEIRFATDEETENITKMIF